MAKRFDYKRLLAAHGFVEALRLDANETATFARQLEEIDARIFEVQYPENKGTLLVPVKSDIDVGAEIYTYDIFDYVGRAAPIANPADDLPRADIQGRQEQTKLYSWGSSYGYSIQDLRRARMARLPLEEKRAMAARRTLATELDQVIFFGYSPMGITGFANNPFVPIVPVITGNWLTASADQILADLLKLESTIYTNSKGLERPDSLVLPPSRYSIIATKPLGNNDDKTILDYFLKKSQFIKNVEDSFQLETANAAGNGPRAVAYTRNPDKLEALVPIEFESFPPEARNLAWVVNCSMRAGGVVWRWPGSGGYMDGI